MLAFSIDSAANAAIAKLAVGSAAVRSPPVLLAIDQGTTGTTAIVFSLDGDPLGRAYSEFTQNFPQPGWVEHDAAEILAVSLKVAREAIDAASLDAAELSAVGITNQRETVVVWDRETGEPLAPAME